MLIDVVYFQIWTSTLQRTIMTASSIVGFPKVGISQLSKCLVIISWCVSNNQVFLFSYVGAMACPGRDQLWSLRWNDIWRDKEEHAGRVRVSGLVESVYIYKFLLLRVLKECEKGNKNYVQWGK